MIDINNISTLTLLKLANSLFCSTKYSFGSITICMKDDKLLNNVPPIIPTPKTNTITVCINTYNESSPITLGVNILFPVIVWNIVVEIDIHTPVNIIDNSFGIR